MPKTNAQKCREYRQKKNKTNKVKKIKSNIKNIPKSSTERVREFRARRNGLLNVPNNMCNVRNNGYTLQISENDHYDSLEDVYNVWCDATTGHNIANNDSESLRYQQNVTASTQDLNISTNISKSKSCKNLANPEENAEANPAETVWIKQEPFSEEEEEKQTPLSPKMGQISHIKIEYDEVEKEDEKVKDVVTIEKLTDNRPDNWEPVLNNIRLMRTEGGALVVEIGSDKCADPVAPDYQLRCQRNATASKQDMNISTNFSKSTSCKNLANPEDEFTMQNNGNIITKKSEENAEANPVDIKQEIVEIKKEPCSEEEEEKQTPLSPKNGRTSHNKLEYDEKKIEDVKVDAACGSDSSTDKIKTLSSLSQQTTLDMGTHMSQQAQNLISSHRPTMLNSGMMNLVPEDQDGYKEDILGNEDMNDSCQDLSNDGMSPGSKGSGLHLGGNTPKTWSQHDMENALDALRNQSMGLKKASETFGIPSTTLWQRAHRLGIDTPKIEVPSGSWSEETLQSALEALRTGTISANKASKAFGISSNTLYKKARREGIRLSAPFGKAPKAWSPVDLKRALQSIRTGHFSVQRASTEFGIPTGTLYGKCKREGIAFARTNQTPPWSEEAMREALKAVKGGQMSINHAAVHYKLPYSSLYDRLKKFKYDGDINGPIDISAQHNIQDSPGPHHMLQQSSQAVHMPDHDNNVDNLSTVNHHPLVLPVSIDNPGDNNSVSQADEESIPIS